MPDLDRREFLKIVGMTAGAAATVACKDPIEKVIPYLNQPEELIPGIATYYNSTCRECPAACGITVKTREGRPIKVDGNPADPISQGRLCVRGLASLHRTYDVTRFRGPMRRDSASAALVPISWEDGIALLVEKLGAAPGKAFFLGGAETGTLDELIDGFMGAIGSPNRLRYEPFAHEALREANRQVFGIDAVPDFALDKADLVVAFGTDFIETWLNPLQNQIRYSAGRKEGRGHAVFVGPRLGVSASNMDQWIAPTPGSEILIALALAEGVARRRGSAGALAGLLAPFGAADVTLKTGIAVAKIDALAERIARASAPIALPPGTEIQGTNAAAFASAVQILNQVSGAIGNTVVFGPNHAVAKLGRFSDLKDLAGKLRGGEIGVLLVHGSDPVYSAPQVAFADAMRSSGAFTVSFSSAEDETTALADLVLPDHTPYEAWGDAEPIAGIRRMQQPTIRPLFDTRALGDVLLQTGRALGGEASLPAGSFRDLLVAKWGAARFDSHVAAGGVFQPAAARSVSLSSGVKGLKFETAQLSGGEGMALVVYPSLHFFDGRSARIAPLHEVPDPVTKTVWESYAEISEQDAQELGVLVGDILELGTEAGKLEVRAYPHQAIRPGVIALQLGQGHRPLDPNAPLPDYRERRRKIGVNALELVPPGRLDAQSGALAYYSTRATVRRTSERGLVARTQPTFDQENRELARAITLAALANAESAGHGAHGAVPASSETHGSVGDHGGGHAADGRPIQGSALHLMTKAYDPAADAAPESPYRWGLSVDLDACKGCGACVVACATENNTAVVGEQNVRIGREMHWIRIARYVETVDDEIDVRHEPMMCQHCGAAPCESVCPALATYHNPEGLNVMVPNRCIGTRFCSNNCPYKARRFNHYPYDFDYAEPENLILNPDVMVRSKGVMEKCTMCLQRINAGKLDARRQGRQVRDGDITTACAQACPSDAIVFGNLRDPESRVTRLRNDKRAYRVLDHLYTRPGVSYQQKILRTEKA